MGEGVKEKKSKGVLLVLIIFLVIIVAGIGLFAGSYMASGKIMPSFSDADKPVNAVTYSVDEFLINLADDDSDRYLKVVIYLSYDSNNKRLAEEIQLERTKPILKDATLTVLRSKTTKDFSTIDGTEAIKKELADKFNSKLESGEIIEVYFPELIIQ